MINRLVLETNSTLTFLFDFIKNTTHNWHERLNNNDKRYIYTYLGEDTDKKPIFEEEEFRPYSDFKGLVGEQIVAIEKSLDFFVSPVGEKWYKKRNLPYQLTLLLHGIPGTGKSCLASAIAKKYELHVVRIKLSTIKTNTQFIKAFKNRTFGNRTFDYQDILYLFDEFDTENNDIIKKRQSDTLSTAPVNLDFKELQRTITKLGQEKSPSSLKNYVDTKIMGPYIELQDSSDKLSLGTILEEMNGINQMYGRKMILITNYPEKLDAALLRPGRIDHNVKLGYCTSVEIQDLIKIFFPTFLLTETVRSQLRTTLTPAEISNTCKFSINIEEVLRKLC